MTPIDDLVKRLRAPAYWMSGSEDGHEGDNDTPLEAADALEALATELTRLRERNAELEKVIAWANNSLFGSHSFFLSANGSKDNEHHLDEAIEKLKEQTGSDYARIASLEAELKAFREALDNATSRARMNDSDGAQVSVDNYHLKNGRRILMSALRNAEGEKDGEPSGD